MFTLTELNHYFALTSVSLTQLKLSNNDLVS
ncbi:MAG: hypothetical protein ACJAVI_002142, partial [Candidatus Azotimanducaceae bacterium]